MRKKRAVEKKKKQQETLSTYLEATFVQSHLRTVHHTT